jgi:citrate synthase
LIKSTEAKMPDQNLPALTAEQAAARLGVKVQTLYAYVARGKIRRTRSAVGSAFDPLEIERFAVARRPSTSSPGVDGRFEGSPLMVIETDLSLIEDNELFYRGRDVAQLAKNERFETVAHWLLTRDWDPEARFNSNPAAVAAARRVTSAMPSSASTRDREQVAVTALGASDPLRNATDRQTAASAGEALVAGMVAALPALGADTFAIGGGTIDALLWSRLSRRPAAPSSLAALNAALILLIDHDIAVSTLAARAAASARASIYAVVTAGFGALDSRLHGNASGSAHRMLSRIVRGEPAVRVVAETATAGEGDTSGIVPGFGQRLYRGIDPRARTLFALLENVDGAAPVLDAVTQTSGLMRARTGAEPNVDLALGALSVAAGMPGDAGEVVFATARSIGWIAHALAEYDETPLRLRPVGRYVGPSE